MEITKTFADDGHQQRFQRPKCVVAYAKAHERIGLAASPTATMRTTIADYRKRIFEPLWTNIEFSEVGFSCIEDSLAVWRRWPKQLNSADQGKHGVVGW